MFKTYYFLYVCGYFACMSVSALGERPRHQNPCEGVVSHHWGGGALELTPDSLEELMVLLTAEPLLQPLSKFRS